MKLFLAITIAVSVIEFALSTPNGRPTHWKEDQSPLLPEAKDEETKKPDPVKSVSIENKDEMPESISIKGVRDSQQPIEMQHPQDWLNLHEKGKSVSKNKHDLLGEHSGEPVGQADNYKPILRLGFSSSEPEKNEEESKKRAHSNHILRKIIVNLDDVKIYETEEDNLEETVIDIYSDKEKRYPVFRQILTELDNYPRKIDMYGGRRIMVARSNPFFLPENYEMTRYNIEKSRPQFY